MLRRAGRTLSKIGCGVSLLLCALTCVLWVRSFWAYDEKLNYFGKRTIILQSCRGTLGISWIDGLPAGWLGPDQWSAQPVAELDDRQQRTFSLLKNATIHSILGFGGSLKADAEYSGFTDPSNPAYGRTWNATVAHLYVPNWTIAVLMLVWPMANMVIRRLRQARDAQGLCANCGYDLRASPLCCPECGTRREEGSEHDKVRGEGARG